MIWSLATALVSLLRWVYRRTGWRPSDQALSRLAWRCSGLHCLPVRMQDGRILYLDLRNPVSVPYLLEGDFPPEQTETRLVKQIVQPGDAAVDIGANVGWYASLLCRLVGLEGRVQAFEPNPHLAPLLHRLARTFPQLSIHEAALSSKDGEADFHIPDNWISGSLARGNAQGTRQRVRVMRLCDVLQGEAVDFVKLDAEGAEVDVLRGAGQILDTPVAPIWLVELSSEEAANFGRHPSEVVEAFATARHAKYIAYGVDQEHQCLRPLELPGSEPFWLNGLFVPASRQSRIPTQWLQGS